MKKKIIIIIKPKFVPSFVKAMLTIATITKKKKYM